MKPISFGMVTVPVKVYSAISSHRVSFHEFQEGTGQRIRHKRVAEGSGEEVGYGEIVKGYEIERGRHVIVTQEELQAVEPGRSRTIEIEDFVTLEDVDPIAWNRTYYLGPQEDAGAEKPYALLTRAMASTGRVAIARFLMRGKQYLATIRPKNGPLACRARGRGSPGDRTMAALRASVEESARRAARPRPPRTRRAWTISQAATVRTRRRCRRGGAHTAGAARRILGE